MKIDVIKTLDTAKYRWCSSAVLTEVKGGRGALEEVFEKPDLQDSLYKGCQLTLNGKPLIQGEYPYCGTCSGIIARGCGIENADSPELAVIRDKINAPFTGMESAVENIKPILSLLHDGYYIVADAVLYPTDGDGHFFANTLDKKHSTDTTVSYYFSESIYGGSFDAFPAFIYPTQSNSCFDIDRANHYLDVIADENAPRAIAYNHRGFLCALLDGHHKAYAAAEKGVMLRTLLIIPMTGYQYSGSVRGQKVGAYFSEIAVSFDGRFKERPTDFIIKDKITFKEYTNTPLPENGLKLGCYPDVEELGNYFGEELDETEMTEELVKKWLGSEREEDKCHLISALAYLSKTDHEIAMMMTENILRLGSENGELTKLAMQFLVTHKSDKAEKLVIDYLIDHTPDPHDPAYMIADGYWEMVAVARSNNNE